MVLAEFLGRAGRVEITERNKLQPVNLVVPAQNLFECEFGFAVGIDRAAGMVSSIGTRSGGPKVAQVDEKTNWRTSGWRSWRRADSVRWRRCSENTWTDSASIRRRARWPRNASPRPGCDFASADSIDCRSCKSPSINCARGSIAARCPSLRLSKMVTACPSFEQQLRANAADVTGAADDENLHASGNACGCAGNQSKAARRFVVRTRPRFQTRSRSCSSSDRSDSLRIDTRRDRFRDFSFAGRATIWRT